MHVMGQPVKAKPYIMKANQCGFLPRDPTFAGIVGVRRGPYNPAKGS